MKSGLVISGSAHSLFLIIIFTNGIFLLSDSPKLSAKNMDVYIITEAEFDAETSIPPSVNTDHHVDEQKSLDSSMVASLEALTNNDIREIKKHEVNHGLESKVMDPDSLNPLSVEISTDNEEQSKLEPDLLLVSHDVSKLEEKILQNSNTPGNEVKSLQKPLLEVPVARNEDRIDRIASDNQNAESISDINAPDTSDLADEDLNEKEEIVTGGENKASTTEITPDGVKDKPIVVSGALENAVIPPSREIVKGNDEEQSDNTQQNEQLLINNLVASLNTDQVPNKSPKSAEISTMEKLKLKKSINQLIGRYWNKGILIGGSDFENYVIKIEILLDSKGNITGDVLPIKPAVPVGRYLIAFREASNAIKAVGKIPLPSEKYPNGLKLKLTFDPASGIGFD